MNATIILADAAQVADGKLHLIGGGWSAMGPERAPMALAILIDVPWDQVNHPHIWTVRLLHASGTPVEMQTTRDGPRTVELTGRFTVSPKSSVPAWAPLKMPIALTFGPMPLTAGAYVWRLSIDGIERDEWTLPFAVFDPPVDE